METSHTNFIARYQAVVKEILCSSPMVLYAAGHASRISDLEFNILHRFTPITGVVEGDFYNTDILSKFASVFKLLLTDYEESFHTVFSKYTTDERKQALREANAQDVTKENLNLPNSCWPYYTSSVAAYVRNRTLKALFQGHYAPGEESVSKAILATDKDVLREVWQAKFDIIEEFSVYDSTRLPLPGKRLNVRIAKAFQRAVGKRYLYEYRQKLRKEVPLKPPIKIVLEALKTVPGLLVSPSFVLNNRNIRKDIVLKWWNRFCNSSEFLEYKETGITADNAAKLAFGLAIASKSAKDAVTMTLKHLDIYAKRHNGIYRFHPDKSFVFIRKEEGFVNDLPICPHCKRLMGKNGYYKGIV